MASDAATECLDWQPMQPDYLCNCGGHNAVYNRRRFPNDLALPPTFILPSPFNLPPPLKILTGGGRSNGGARFRTYLNKKKEYLYKKNDLEFI
jgi:hypothetical protein